MDISEEAAFPVDYYVAPTVNIRDQCLRSHRRIREQALRATYVILCFINTRAGDSLRIHVMNARPVGFLCAFNALTIFI